MGNVMNCKLEECGAAQMLTLMYVVALVAGTMRSIYLQDLCLFHKSQKYQKRIKLVRKPYDHTTRGAHHNLSSSVASDRRTIEIESGPISVKMYNQNLCELKIAQCMPSLKWTHHDDFSKI